VEGLKKRKVKERRTSSKDIICGSKELYSVSRTNFEWQQEIHGACGAN
jgi:hypothetical protein